MSIFTSNPTPKNSPQQSQGILNIIGQGTRITGDLISNGDFRVDGSIEGHVKVGQRLVIGNTGKILGNIEVDSATIAGHIKGNITVKQVLELKPTAKIDGDIITNKMVIESGAQFNGRCSMNVVVSVPSATPIPPK
ncbi:MAG: polymer-forming cytoskeletal protein [Flavobacteriaceae bacterium]|nr:polymer-forming cytoskeletal protein [Flavobacteriaceae bacterium]